jgi:hypothetical protein
MQDKMAAFFIDFLRLGLLNIIVDIYMKYEH